MERNKFILIGVLLVALISVTVALVYISNILSQVSSNGSQGQFNANMEVSVPLSQIQEFVIDDSITTNLMAHTENDPLRYIRVGVSLGLDQKGKDFRKLAPQLEEQKGIIRSYIVDILQSQDYHDMIRGDAKGRLEEEILMKLRQEFQTQTITKVYIKDMAVH